MAPANPFGDFLLFDRVSVGGMAEVFRARRVGPGRDARREVVAIKRILPSMAADPAFLTMFRDEALIAGMLEHGHIARVHALDEHAGSHFIVMEFVRGRDLLQVQHRARRRKERIPFELAAYVAACVGDGLDYAHRRAGTDGEPLCIVHRDVSPQNVIVGFDGSVKLVDFGIAKAASRATRTLAGVLKGKLGYMSPEQVEGLPIDRRSDVFGLGTLLYETLTLDRLFLEETDFATLEKVRTVDVPPIEERVQDCPPALARIVGRALAREPAERYAWASEVRDDLRRFLASRPSVFGQAELSAWMAERFAVEKERDASADETARGV